MKKNFAIIGCAGFVAPRHLQAIKDTGNNLIAALDKSDSVGILDKYSFNTRFFTEFERLDRFAEKLRRKGEDERIHYVSICSPNYLHDAHIRFALRIGANAICEKPVVINPWNLDALSHLEEEHKKKVFGIMQLRYQSDLVKLKNQIKSEDISDKKHDVELTYITPRGPWYEESWKGDEKKSGGVVVNLGIHFFDILTWIFGNEKYSEIHYSQKNKAAGYLELDKAYIKWFLSTDREDVLSKNDKPYRLIKIDNKEFEFSETFGELHIHSYIEILNGRGFGIEDVRNSIDLTYKIRKSNPIKEIDKEKAHNILISNKDLLKNRMGGEM